MVSLALMTAWLVTAQVSAPPAAADLAPDVARLVRQLNSDELTRRDQAEQQLIALGPAALPHLPPTNDRTPAEVAQRLLRVRQAFEQARAEQAAQGSTVSLTGDLPLTDIFKDFGKQTGNAIVDRREREEGAVDPPLHVDFNKTLFWRAVDQTLDEAQLDVDSFSGEPGVTITPRTPGRVARTSRASYSGPFRLEPARFEAIRDLRNPGNRSLKLFIEVAWEPRLKPIVISQPLDLITATAGDEEVRIDGQGEPAAPINDGAASVELVIPLASPARTQGKISSLKGTLKAIVPGEVETFRFSELPATRQEEGKKKAGGAAAKKIEQRKAAVTVALDGLRKNGEIWELQVRVRFDDPAGALDSYLSGWLLNNEVFMEKAGQMPIEPGGFEQFLQNANEIGVKYLFDLPDGPKGCTFVYKSPTAVFTVPIEYELKDLELP
jgi:hypothetical protein